MLSHLSSIAEPSDQVTIVEVTKDRIITDTAPVSVAVGLEASFTASFSDRKAKDLVKVFRLLSDETRLRTVLHLYERGELHVRALCECLRQSQPAVSHHLGLLRVAGIVDCRRQGKHNFYRLMPGPVAELLTAVFSQSLAAPPAGSIEAGSVPMPATRG